MKRRIEFMAIAAASSLAFVACEDSDSSGRNTAEPVSIAFEVMAGDELVESGESYTVGAPETEFTVGDFVGFWIHDVALISADGERVAVTLDESNPYQKDGHVLFTFVENEFAANPSDTVNTVLSGTVEAGEYTVLEFTLGVDPSMNHLDAGAASGPFANSEFYWAWASGYKFMRLDGPTTNNPAFRLHLGSSGCVANDSDPGASTCATTNNAVIRVSDFELGADAVVLDIEELFAGANIDTNTEDTAPGCMSSPDDPECSAIFANLGLSHPLQGAEPTGQSAFFSMDVE